jgi:integration host factor subunit alpha
MKRALSDGEEILISGFGKFCVSEKQVKGQVLLQGEDTARYLVKKIVFKCSPLFRDRINGK